MRLTALAHPSLLCEYKKIPLLSDIEIMLQSEDSVICRESSRFSSLRKHHSQRRISSSSLDAACNKNGELVMLSPQQLIVSHASTLRKHRTGAAQFCPSQDALAIKKKQQTNHVIPTTNRVSVVIW